MIDKIKEAFEEWWNQDGYFRYPENAFRAGYKACQESLNAENERLKKSLERIKELPNSGNRSIGYYSKIANEALQEIKEG